MRWDEPDGNLQGEPQCGPQGDPQRTRRQRRREHRETRRRTGTETGRRGSLPERLVRAYFEEADPLTQTLLLSWVSFGATFGLARLFTHGIKGRWLPFAGNVRAGGLHLHHYNLGILLLTGLGLLAVRGRPKPDGHRPVAGIAFGVGTALVADEAALLLNLEDVYWAEKGRVSINVVVGILSALGLYVAGEPFFDDAVREVRRGIGRIR